LICSSRVACKKERGRSSCTNALPSTDASAVDVPAVHNPNGMASSIYWPSRGCVWRRAGGADFASASHFFALTLPWLWAHRTVSRPYSRVPQSLWRCSATTSIRTPSSPPSPLLAEGGLGLWWGREGAFSVSMAWAQGGTRCILVTAVTVITRITGCA
jgi:hypothetical protein